MSKRYETEREGQIAFFKNYGIPFEDGDVLIENTDGVYNGILYEFKLNISNMNSVLFQAIKYLSKMRIKGESVPATILLIDLNGQMAYEYKSEDYRADIHKVYTGSASKHNDGFKGKKPVYTYEYGDLVESNKLKHLLKQKKADPEGLYMPIDIDENCIVGWSERYYRENPKADKGDFLGDIDGEKIKKIGEIREPVKFKSLINAYTSKSNERFKYLMDCLNARIDKKDLGAFYTPMPYCKKAAELVKMAVDRVPEGNDYIILDRCAGTGNLEEGLKGIKDRNGDELISHCVVSTYEYYEYKVLNERIGDLVRDIIPPTEADVVYFNGKVSNADAMSEDFINNPIIKAYVDDPKCNVILMENPPYSDTSAMTYTDSGSDVRKRKKSDRKNSYVAEQYKLLSPFKNSASSRDLSNLFIWSGFNFYLRDEKDSYIIFSPIKYYKNNPFMNYAFSKGYAFNRKHFHATSSVVTCILWENRTTNNEQITLDAFDIVDESLHKETTLTIKKTKATLSKLYDTRTFTDDIPNTVYCAGDGYDVTGQKILSKSIYNDNIIGYLRTDSAGISPMHVYLTRCTLFNGAGFHLRNDSYISKLPLFVAKLFPQDRWYDKDVYYTTSDGGEVYTQDSDFLKSCLIYTCLSNQNKCLSFKGSDGRDYQNELCFDADTLANNDLDNYVLDTTEQELIDLWKAILEEAKTTANYNEDFKYGVYQITKELNTFKEIKKGSKKSKEYDYPILNGNLETLRVKLKEYYQSHITDKMFKYELLK